MKKNETHLRCNSQLNNCPHRKSSEKRIQVQNVWAEVACRALKTIALFDAFFGDCYTTMKTLTHTRLDIYHKCVCDCMACTKT